MIIDVHTHRPAPYPPGIVAHSALEPFNPIAEQAYCVGIHPWDVTPELSESQYSALEQTAENPAVAAIGECGIDMLKNIPLYKQILIFTRHIRLSEKLRKPLIIHCVKAHDHIISLKREYAPEMPWIIHGFRQRKSIAKLFLDAGCFLSFGEKFNPESLQYCPPERLLAETDASKADIHSVIASLALCRGKSPENLKEQIAAITSQIFYRD